MITTTIRSRSTTAFDRLDAHFFTSPGVAASERIAVLEAAGVKVQRIEEIADVSDPARFARVYATTQEESVPYLRPYDVFDYLPVASDHLSLERTADVEGLIPDEGTILQTCSGRNLGPVTIADATLSGFALSHDMIRIKVPDPVIRHYLLAFLKTATGQALLRRGKSGSVVDHITVADVEAVPVPIVDTDLVGQVASTVGEALELASDARMSLSSLLAEQEAALPAPRWTTPPRSGWTVRSGSLGSRIDAAYHAPVLAEARQQMSHAGGPTIGELAAAYLPTRYKRYYVQAGHGRPILSGRQLLQLEPVNLRRVSDRSFRNPEDYELSDGMTVFGAVGRSEGRQGAPALIAGARSGWLASNDVMRLVPHAGVRPGALWLAVASRQARMQINALSFGSVVDHMNPWDVEEIRVPNVSNERAEATELAWRKFSEADIKMRAAVAFLDDFMHGA